MQAKFTQGSIFKHVCTMTLASSVGLASLFLVDLVDMYWLSLLGELQLAAAIGYAGSILFFTLSLGIGLSIGCAALVSQAIGAELTSDKKVTSAEQDGDKQASTKQRSTKRPAARLVSHIFIAIVAITLPVAIGVFSGLQVLLSSLGAQGRALELAQAYMTIIVPSLPLLGVAMACSGVMRSLGNAKEAMYLTLTGGIVNAILDPLFIFGLGWGIEGAAVATVFARIAMVIYGLYLVAVKYQLIQPPQWQGFLSDIKNYAQTALPAALTNLSTPIGVAYTTAVMAQFGDSAVAGNAIISKVQPLLFAGLFALSGSIGPIAGQNLGARLFPRIMMTLRDSMIFTFAYCAVACLALFLLTPYVVSAFNAEGDAKQLIVAFCYGLSLASLFNGMTFVSNALFNNLKVAPWATGFNFAKATIFTMPFVYLGAEWGGPVGIYWGLLIGSAIIGLAGLAVAYWKIRRLPLESAA